MKPEAHVPVAAYAHEHPVLQNPGETRTLDHLPQLDGIRAIAVAMVLWSHFIPKSLSFRQSPPWGAVGVGLFFVLSGFLITRILLNSRLKIADGRAGYAFTFKQFYVRRMLRIFPLYYATLIGLWIFNVTDFRNRANWSFAYLTNYRFAGYWKTPVSGAEGHLWSLSVEEQFYIFWPFMVLLCPRKLLLPMIVLCVATGPVWRIYTYEQGLLKHEWMTPGCLDLLCGGALLAFLSLPKFGWSKYRDAFVQICGLVGVPMCIAYMAQRWYPTVEVHGRPTGWGYDFLQYGGAVYPMTALTGIWLVGTAARGFSGPIGWFLTFAPVVYIGRISYGIYVLHMLVPRTLAYFAPETFGRQIDRVWWHTVLYVAISIAAASLSWFLFESPINKLKRYFEYDKTASAKAPTAAVSA